MPEISEVGGPSWSRHLGVASRWERHSALGHLQSPIKTTSQVGPPPFSGDDIVPRVATLSLEFLRAGPDLQRCHRCTRHGPW